MDFADKQVTEISCHGPGARLLAPAARTVIDIGGQDSKVIQLDEHGNLSDFLMNDKCAAGTGLCIYLRCLPGEEQQWVIPGQTEAIFHVAGDDYQLLANFPQQA